MIKPKDKFIFNGIFIILTLLFIGFLCWGFLYPWKTQDKYVKNLTWSRTIEEKYDITECDFIVNSEGQLKRKCHIKVYTVNIFIKQGTYEDKIYWPEYHQERDDSYLVKSENYCIIFDTTQFCNKNQDEWKSYQIGDKFQLIKSPFGNLTQINSYQ